MNMKNVLELDELELCNWIYIISIDIDRSTTIYSQIK